MAPTKRHTTDTAWLRDFQELLNRPEEKLPPGSGWLTVDQMKAATGSGRNRIQKFVRGLVEAGDYEEFTGSQFSKELNKSFRQVWYRPANKNRAHPASRLAP